MRIKAILAAAAAILLPPIQPASAGIINGSFENGLSGWTVLSSGDAAIVGSVTAFSGTSYVPTDGSKLLSLSPNQKHATWIMQSAPAIGGSEISFDWAFLAFDYFPFLDYGSVFIEQMFPDGSSSIDDLPLASVWNAGNFGDTGWQRFSYQLDPNAIAMDLGFFSTNGLDTLYPSKLLIDNIRTAAVPEPGMAFLIGIGLFALMTARHRQPAARTIGLMEETLRRRASFSA